jgi:hypothetical protein
MKTKSYVYGVEKLNGYDAWALFTACAAGDWSKVKSLVAKERRLVNAQFWYQFPIHMAVREGHADIVRFLLKQGADPGQSRYTYDSWDKLLRCAQETLGHAAGRSGAARSAGHCASAKATRRDKGRLNRIGVTP